MERDSFASPQKYEMRIFQSTPSVWRETGVSTDTGLQGIISIHSLRVEGDQDAPQCITAPYLFQSTPSVWRETFVAMFIPPVDFQFQSTPSVWRETLFHHQGRRVDSISIHSLRVEGDQEQGQDYTYQKYFNPLPPCGGRLSDTRRPVQPDNFNPLPPCGGRQEVICIR